MCGHLGLMQVMEDEDQASGIRGVLCAGARGLCIEAKGVANPRAAGFFTSIIRRANSLAPAEADAPTVLVETDQQHIVVKEYDDLTVAVYQALPRKR